MLSASLTRKVKVEDAMFQQVLPLQVKIRLKKSVQNSDSAKMVIEEYTVAAAPKKALNVDILITYQRDQNK